MRYWARFNRCFVPTTVLLHGKSHGWRSLVGYSPWGYKESDMTEQLHFTCSYSKFSESINMGSSEANRKYRKRLVLKLEKYELCITLE